MKHRITSALLSILLLLSLFSGCAEFPDTAVEIVPEIQTTVAEKTAVSVSQTDIVDSAYALGIMETLEGEQRLTGTVTQIVTGYNSKYGNISVEMTVAGREDKPVLCFRLEGTGVQDLQPGDEITVSGQLLNYKGTVEFDAGCVLESFEKGEAVTDAETPCDDSAEAVAAYIRSYGCLPDFYMTKDEARDHFGWDGGALDNLAPGMAIGGDRFGNYEEQLPEAPGRYYTECDIGTIENGSRGAKRIVFSNDGLVFYTEDHYETFELLYGEP